MLVMMSMSTKQQLCILASIGHSIGKLRRQLKHAHIVDEDLDRRWKLITPALVVLLRQHESQIVDSKELLDRGDFTAFIEAISEEEPLSDEAKENVGAFIAHFRAIEKGYISLIQRWRARHPTKTIGFKIYMDPSEFHTNAYLGTTYRYIDTSDLYAIMVYATDDWASVLAADKFSTQYRILSTEQHLLTKQECRNLGMKHPAKAVGLYR